MTGQDPPSFSRGLTSGQRGAGASAPLSGGCLQAGAAKRNLWHLPRPCLRSVQRSVNFRRRRLGHGVVSPSCQPCLMQGNDSRNKGVALGLSQRIPGCFARLRGDAATVAPAASNGSRGQRVSPAPAPDGWWPTGSRRETRCAEKQRRRTQSAAAHTPLCVAGVVCLQTE